MCNRARLDSDPETLREKFGAKWPGDVPNRWPASATMVTCDPDELVAPIHPKAMNTVLMAEDQDRWLSCDYDEVVKLQRPCLADRMTVRGPEFPTRAGTDTLMLGKQDQRRGGRRRLVLKRHAYDRGLLKQIVSDVGDAMLDMLDGEGQLEAGREAAGRARQGVQRNGAARFSRVTKRDPRRHGRRALARRT